MAFHSNVFTESLFYSEAAQPKFHRMQNIEKAHYSYEMPNLAVSISHLVYLGVILGVATPVWGAGEIDTTFGNGTGRVLHQEIERTTVIAVGESLEGKVNSSGWTGSSNFIYRFRSLNADGSPNTSFSSSPRPGTITRKLGKDHDYAGLIEPDGAMLVTGYSQDNTAGTGPVFGNNTGRRFANVIKMKSDGRTAFTFIKPDNFGNFGMVARGIVRQPDGKYIVVGKADNIINDVRSESFVFRLDANGQLDTTFNETGFRIFDPGSGVGANQATSVGIMPGGRILIAGDVSRSGKGVDFYVGMLNPDGTTDTTWGNSGWIYPVSSSSSDMSKGGFVDSKGRIVIYGLEGSGSSWHPIIVRLLGDGSRDNTFDGDGKLALPEFDREGISALIELPSGRLAAGTSKVAGPLLWRKEDGSPETTYGLGGKTILDVGVAGASNKILSLSVGYKTGNIYVGMISVTGSARETAAVFRVKGEPKSSAAYDEWSSNIDWQTIPAAQRLPSADPDGDGRSNLLEAALGGKPTTADGGKDPVVRSTPAGLRFEFDVRAGGASGLSYVIQRHLTGDLSPEGWVDHATYSPNSNPLSNGITHSEQVALSLAVNGKLFLRLKVIE